MLIEVLFDRPENRYTAGENVSGKILITNDTVKYVKRITAELKGCTSCSWSEQRAGKEENKSGTDLLEFVNFINLQTHFKHTISLEEMKEYQTVKLKPGDHFYDFNYSLPENLPSSITGKHGRTVYMVFVLVRMTNHKRQSKEAAFNVIATLNINQIGGEVFTPFALCVLKNIGCCKRRCGSIRATILSTRRGFLTGDAVPFKIVIFNKTFRQVK